MQQGSFLSNAMRQFYASADQKNNWWLQLLLATYFWDPTDKNDQISHSRIAHKIQNHE